VRIELIDERADGRVESGEPARSCVHDDVERHVNRRVTYERTQEGGVTVAAPIDESQQLVRVAERGDRLNAGVRGKRIALSGQSRAKGEDLVAQLPKATRAHRIDEGTLALHHAAQGFDLRDECLA
jgi:hypothetical protein